jgi:hypothetical protein
VDLRYEIMVCFNAFIAYDKDMAEDLAIKEASLTPNEIWTKCDQFAVNKLKPGETFTGLSKVRLCHFFYSLQG